MKKNRQGYPTPKVGYYKVFIRSNTYNQSVYIEDCLNGVAMQQTDFPFVHYVIDDCSTDGEQNVIKAWMDRECDMDNAEYYDNDICTITLVNNKKNPNCTLVVYFLKKNMYGNPTKRELYKLWSDVCPYMALCEGDDYWIDPYKLQKQVDWLDSHEDYGLVYCNYDSLIQDTGVIIPKQTITGRTSAEELLLYNCIGTLTVMLHCSLYDKFLMENNSELRNKWKMSDYPMWLWFAINSKIGFLPDVVARYRVLSNSLSHTPDIRKKYGFALNSYEISIYFAKKYGFAKEHEIILREKNKILAFLSLIDWNVIQFFKYYKLSSRITLHEVVSILKNNVKSLLYTSVF